MLDSNNYCVKGQRSEPSQIYFGVLPGIRTHDILLCCQKPTSLWHAAWYIEQCACVLCAWAPARLRMPMNTTASSYQPIVCRRSWEPSIYTTILLFADHIILQSSNDSYLWPWFGFLVRRCSLTWPSRRLPQPWYSSTRPIRLYVYWGSSMPNIEDVFGHR